MDGLDAAGSESVALLLAGLLNRRQSKLSCCPSEQPRSLSASWTTAERVTTSPGFGPLELAVAEVMEGVAKPQVVVLNVTNFGADCRPVESVATTENW